MHQAHSGARHVDGHVAAAHHNNPLAQFNLESKVDVDQEVDAVVDPRKVRSRDVQFAAFVEASGQQNRIELRAQVGEGDVAPKRHAGMQRDTHGQDVIHLHLDDFPRKAELRDAQIEHSAGNRGGLEDLDRV
jgi:hypothetical protein